VQDFADIAIDVTDNMAHELAGGSLCRDLPPLPSCGVKETSLTPILVQIKRIQVYWRHPQRFRSWHGVE
jgi:hypothetical protein